MQTLAPPCAEGVGRWQREALTEGPALVAPDPSTTSLRAAVPLPIGYADREELRRARACSASFAIWAVSASKSANFASGRR